MSADRRVVIRRAATAQYVALGVAAVLFRWSAGPAEAVLGALAVVAGVAASVAVHEGAHALTAVRAGLRVVGVEVRGLLGASVRRSVTHDPRIDVRVRMAGPAATALVLVLCGAALALPVPAEALRVVQVVTAVNALALVVSLAGGAESDGVRAWRSWQAARERAVPAAR
ncbi:UNVERIFIED_ORG: hypothetical protein E4P37_17255 [Bacillus sp. AZ43]